MFRNAVQLFNTVSLNKSRDSASLLSSWLIGEFDGVDGGISMKAEALEPDLFEQSEQMKK